MVSRLIIKLSIVDLLTLAGGVSSIVAIGLAMHDRLALAIALCFIAMFADAYDGLLARSLKIESEFGRYLDSFMDVLAYLVAPSVILYQLGFDGLFSLVLIALVLCGCLRLAVFNQVGTVPNEGGGQAYFGMPVFWSTFILAATFLLQLFLPVKLVFALTSAALLGFCVAMLHKSSYPKISSQCTINGLVSTGVCVFIALHFLDYPLFSDWSEQFPNELWVALLIQLPIVLGGSFHMVVVTRDWFSQLKVPLSEPLFGANKTLRGFVIVPVATSVFAIATLCDVDLSSGFYHAVPSLSVIGLVVGLGYMIGELPNSYIKRRLGILPGESAKGWLFTLMDQMDSNIGIVCCLLLIGLKLSTCVLFIVTFPITAMLVKRCLYALNLKATKA